MKLDLTGEWQFRASDEADYRSALVPGCQFLDLMREGVIPDPFVGENEHAVRWVHDKDYVYRKVVDVPAEILAYAHVELVCTQLDTLCHLEWNGQAVGDAENCHRAYRFDVKPYLRMGENEVILTFFSAKRYVEKRYRQSPTPPNCNGQNGIVYIRKPQCHFGWDWGPVLTPAGISGDIYLDAWTRPRPEAPRVRTRPDGTGYLVRVEAAGADRIRLIDPDGAVTEALGDVADFAVTDPRLWWTYELSGSREQPLYTVEAQTLAGEEVADTVSCRVGLRTITLNREKDAYGHNFQFILNGVPLFIKGANYIPPDTFITRFDQARLDAMLDAVRFSHMNMLRVWGGGYYADDALLDACDRRGILLWQDCMFACQAYPFFDDDFRANVLEEIAYNVRRLATHPCLAVWCGNNEIEDMHMAWAAMHRYVEWTERFFYHILPAHIALYDDCTPYTPGSPIGSAHNRDVGADHVGDTHLWGVWHGLQPMTHYRRRMTRFCSEFGFESLPSMRAIRSYATPDRYSLHSKVQRSHQKCANGNDKMLYYIASRFRLSRDIEDLVYLSQVTQQACIADATEHWRRHKGRCNGAMYWQLNDCWPTCSWSSYDYAGQYKALQYTAAHFNAPLSVSLEDVAGHLRVHVLNDLTTPHTVEVEIIPFRFDRLLPAERIRLEVAALSNQLVRDMDLSGMDPRREGVAVRLYEHGVCLMQKTHLMRHERHLALPVGPIAIEETAEDGRRKITLHTEVYQRLVMLENDAAQPFSDNFFDLLPGETKVVWQDAAATLPTTARTVTTLRRGPAIYDVWAHIKVFLSPRNLAGAAYHGRVPHTDEEQP